jgi:hypothetical protein
MPHFYSFLGFPKTLSSLLLNLFTTFDLVERVKLRIITFSPLILKNKNKKKKDEKLSLCSTRASQFLFNKQQVEKK